MLNSSNNISSAERSIFSSGISSLITTARALSFVFSVTNLFVLHRLRFKSPIYIFLFSIALADTFYSLSMLLLGFMNTVYTSNPQEMSKHLIGHIYCLMIIYISDYLTSCLALFTILIEVFLTTQRICLLSNANLRKKRAHVRSTRSVILGLAVVSFLAYIPLLFMTRLEQERGRFILKKTPFGRTYIAEYIKSVLSVTRLGLVTLVLLVLNLVAIVRYKSFYLRKKRLKNLNSMLQSDTLMEGGSDLTGKLSNLEQKNLEENMKKAMKERKSASLNSRQVTLMLITVTFLYIVGNLPLFFYYLFKSRLESNPSIRNLIFAFTQLSMSLLLILKFFVYYFFNQPFRQKLQAFDCIRN